MGIFGKKAKRAAQGEDPLASLTPADTSSADQPTDAAQPAAASAKPKKRRKKKKGISLSTIIPVLLMLIGAGVVAYPTFSDWWNSYHQTRAIASYASAVEETDQETIDAMLEAAHAYNERLLTKPNRYVLSDEEKAEYESILDLTGTGVIGYIQCNSIGVNYPIYHGVAESVLQVAIGHIEGSSLPVGGPSTHAAVSGHRGLPSARLFTDLDQLVEGDTFTITVLDQTATYEVDQIRIVEPQDMSDLNIVQDADLCTLITCTPYGINTHRLLVRGHRVANIDGTAVIPAEAVQIPNYVAVPAVGLPMLFVYLVGALIYYRRKNVGYDRDKVMEELGELAGTGETAETEASAEAEAEAPAEAEAEVEAPAEAEPAADSELPTEADPAAEPQPDSAAETPSADAETTPTQEAADE